MAERAGLLLNRVVTVRRFERRFAAVVAGQAELVRGGRDQQHAGSVFSGPDLVTAQTPGGDGRVDGRTLRLVFVALQAFGVIGLGIERNRVNRTESTW